MTRFPWKTAPQPEQFRNLQLNISVLTVMGRPGVSRATPGAGSTRSRDVASEKLFPKNGSFCWKSVLVMVLVTVLEKCVENGRKHHVCVGTSHCIPELREGT